MMFETSPRIWLGAVSWHVRGLFATEANRRIGFAARELWQPAEIEARRGLARDLATELVPEHVIDRQTGYRMLAPSVIPDVNQICDIGRAVGAKTAEDGDEHPGSKMFFRYRLAREDQRLALVRIGLDRGLVAMVSAYLGVLPVMTEADFLCSDPVEGAFTKSQLWHCDDDAGDVLKIFIYCDDVAEHDGPFELVTAEPSRRARAALGYRYAGRRYRVSDEAMSGQIGPTGHTSLVGPRGTTFVVDTVRCFHRGSRIVEKGHHRIAAMICYTPPAALTLPRRLAAGKAPLADFAPNFSGALERAVLGLPIATKWL